MTNPEPTRTPKETPLSSITDSNGNTIQRLRGDVLRITRTDGKRACTAPEAKAAAIWFWRVIAAKGNDPTTPADPTAFIVETPSPPGRSPDPNGDSIDVQPDDRQSDR